MGKTYEALMRAEKVRLPESPALVEPDKGSMPETAAPCQYAQNANLEPYEHLKTNLFARCRQGELKTILFNGTMSGCG